MGKSSHRSRSNSRTSLDKSVGILKRRRSSSSDSSSGSSVSKKRSKRSSKKNKRSPSTSSTSGSSSGSSVRKRKKKLKRKEKRKRKKEKKKRKKKFKKEKKKKDGTLSTAPTPPVGPNVEPPPGTSSPPVGPGEELASKSKVMAPMTKEEWEKRQSVVRRVFDEETGRYRLIKGDGEVLEEIVSRDRHREINKQATRGDGAYFQSTLNLQR